jgi:polyphosphate kinase
MNKNEEERYAVIEIPKTINRFVVLLHDEKQYIILLDDVIRHNLSNIFNILITKAFLLT